MLYFLIGRAVSFAVYADMAELADASALGADVLDVGVQIPLSAPNGKRSNFFKAKKTFGLFCYINEIVALTDI